ncbi:MmgE/PrpD family protein [Nonomuraea mesophila]|uniref:MmgE/PrpD family protein n=1 Tax=Nonomuraea mesophila TaxID=2530382 RepID=A0A4V2Z908_9ACTN|nr:MmgE/PrpD family protein [Nonomuraea mesophila]TDE42401.1 MmgE/PrpD family protein [Nonomuraea mesophila]
MTTPVTRVDPLRALAGFVAGPPPPPPDVAERAERHLLDTLGAALAGATTPAPGLAGPGDAPVWGTGLSAAPRDAALLNGVAAHALELDDTGGCDHSGAVVVPAALACLSLTGRPVTGRDLLEAVVLGYDVARRTLEACGGYAAHNEAGWHSTGTCGTFGAAAASARLLGLDAARTAHALGLAAGFSGGLWAFVHDGAAGKRLHAGRAAEGGLTAALLAASGASGPGRVFDDVWGGFLRTYAGAHADPGALTRGLGTEWRISRCSIKPYASCRSTHSAIDAVGGLDLCPGDIARIHVRLSPLVAGMCGGRDVATLPAAQLSLPYAIAARILYGDADLAAYSPERRHDPRAAALMDLIDLEADEEMGGIDEPFLTVTTTSGAVRRARVSHPLGSPANPLSDERLLAKFHGLAPGRERLADHVMTLGSRPDARALLPLL